MSELISKISSYNLFNYLFPWIIFTILTKYLIWIDFIQSELVLWVFLYYFIWATISRIWSLIIEPLFKLIGLIEFADFKDYLIAEKGDKKISDLLEISNMYRTTIAIFLLLFWIKLYIFIQNYVPFMNEYKKMIVIILLFILYIVSYKKQVSYIKKRVDNFNPTNIWQK